MSLWQWEELQEACALKVSGKGTGTGPGISGISLDSRKVTPGDLFVALSGDPGPRFYSSSASERDGHEFIQQALDGGASAVMVSRPVNIDAATLTVDNTLDGLWQLGCFARDRVCGKVAAVTGSSGKTTARCWLEELLTLQGSTHASVGSLNNHWGVPLSLARMPANSEFAIFEIGTNRPGEIQPLAELVRPDVAVLLNVLPAHIGHFGDLEGIRTEKLNIACGLLDSGTLIVPDALDLTGSAHINKITFGMTPNADVSGKAIFAGGETEVTASICGNPVSYRLAVGGEHRVLTSLAVLATIHCMGADVKLAAEAFASLTVPRGRGNVIDAGGVHIVDDSYNANPVSMAYAIQALNTDKPGGRRIALLGEMLELGASSDQAHAETIALTSGLDRVVTVGKGFAAIPGNQEHYDQVGDMDLENLITDVRPGDVILVKGSNLVFWAADFVTRLADALKTR